MTDLAVVPNHQLKMSIWCAPRSESGPPPRPLNQRQLRNWCMSLKPYLASFSGAISECLGAPRSSVTVRFHCACAAVIRPQICASRMSLLRAVSYTHLRAHETRHDLVCRLL